MSSQSVISHSGVLHNGARDSLMSPGSLSSVVKTGNPDEVLSVGMNGTNVSTHNKLMPCSVMSDSYPSPTGIRKRSCRESKTKAEIPESKRKREEEEPISKANGTKGGLTSWFVFFAAACSMVFR